MSLYFYLLFHIIKGHECEHLKEPKTRSKGERTWEKVGAFRIKYVRLTRAIYVVPFPSRAPITKETIFFKQE
jgi:hypothetical protein